MLTVIQNDPEVPLGAYSSFLREKGIPFRLLRPYAGDPLPPLSETAALIVLGGAMGVHDFETHPFLVPLKQLIKEAVAGEIPFFGICLGGQLLADCLGGTVISSSPFGEKGTLSVTLTPEGVADPLFAEIEQEFFTFQWHNDSFTIPPAAVRLALSAACPNQAFRWGAKAYAVQFHPEVYREIVDLWARWSEDTAPSADRFVGDFDLHLPKYQAASRRLLVNFLRLANLL